MKLRVVLLLLCVGFLYGPVEHAHAQAWQKLGDDLEQRAVSVSGPHIFSAEIFLLRTSLRRYSVRVVRAADFLMRSATVRRLSERSRALVGINANFFDEDSKPLGLIVKQGNHLSRLHRGGSALTGVFFMGMNHPAIVHRDDYKAAGVLHAVQAGPRLLADGKVIEGLRDADVSTRRSGVCIDREDRLVFFCTSSVFTGVSLRQLQSVLLDPSINCKDALNLDGGGSAQMYVANAIPGAPRTAREIDIPGQDPVPVMLGLFLKDEGF